MDLSRKNARNSAAIIVFAGRAAAADLAAVAFSLPYDEINNSRITKIVAAARARNSWVVYSGDVLSYGDFMVAAGACMKMVAMVLYGND